MLDHFTLRHIAPLFVATTTTFGGLWPLWDARSAMLEFGFPAHIAETRATHPVMITSSARTSVLGALILVFYFQGNLSEMDTVIALFGTYIGLTDWWALRNENGGKAVFRLVSGLLIGTWGIFGMSSI